MSQSLHDENSDNANAIAILRIFSDNSRAKNAEKDNTVQRKYLVAQLLKELVWQCKGNGSSCRS